MGARSERQPFSVSVVGYETKRKPIKRLKLHHVANWNSLATRRANRELRRRAALAVNVNPSGSNNISVLPQSAIISP